MMPMRLSKISEVRLKKIYISCNIVFSIIT